MDRTVSISGDSHIGVFTRVFEDIAVIPFEAPEVGFEVHYREAFDLEIVRTNIQGSPIGSLLLETATGLWSPVLRRRQKPIG